MLGDLEDLKFRVKLLVALLLNGDFLFLVPVPLIDLAFAEAKVFAQTSNFLFSPVGVFVELFLKHFHLVAAFPEAETVGLGQKAQPPLFGRAGRAGAAAVVLAGVAEGIVGGVDSMLEFYVDKIQLFLLWCGKKQVEVIVRLLLLFIQKELVLARLLEFEDALEVVEVEEAVIVEGSHIFFLKIQ